MLKLDYNQCVISHRDCDICEGEKKGLYLIGKYEEEEFTYFMCMDCLHAMVLATTMLMGNFATIESEVIDSKEKAPEPERTSGIRVIKESESEPS